MLKRNKIECLADVRSFPGSRHNPQFNSDDLTVGMGYNDIGYVLMQKLGGFRKPTDYSINTGLRNKSFRGYADYMQGPSFQSALAKLETLARMERCAIMCSEAVPWRCHRSMIADALVARGWRVKHILQGKKVYLHELSEAARVGNDPRSIYYPTKK